MIATISGGSDWSATDIAIGKLVKERVVFILLLLASHLITDYPSQNWKFKPGQSILALTIE